MVDNLSKTVLLCLFIGAFLLAEVAIIYIFLFQDEQEISKDHDFAKPKDYSAGISAFRQIATTIVDGLQVTLASQGGRHGSELGDFIASLLAITKDEQSVVPLFNSQSTSESRTPDFNGRTESLGHRHVSVFTLLFLVAGKNVDFASTLKLLTGNLMEACLFIAADSILVKDAIPKSMCSRIALYKNSNTSSLAQVWETLLSEVTTPYVLVLTNCKQTWLHSFNLLETLSLFDDNQGIQGITFPLAHGKMRSLNCYRYDLQMYQLSLISEPSQFISGHPLCHYSYGPFASRTSAARNMSWHGNEKAMMLDFFLELMIQGMAVAHCSRCGTVSVTGKVHVFDDKESLVPFAKKWELNSIRVGDTRMKFTCEETDSVCRWDTQKLGKAMPLCCSVKQNEVTMKLLRLCQRLGMHYEFNEGSILGAVKLGCSMPWDIDADIFFDSGNITLMKKSIFGTFDKAGLSIGEVEGYSAYEIEVSEWYYKGIHIDLYPMHFHQNPLSWSNVKDGQFLPTAVWFLHWLAPVPFNPGLRVRNRYGYECFQHSLHWRIFANENQQMFGGRFMPCNDSSHHACLDVFMPDGNLQFKSWGHE